MRETRRREGNGNKLRRHYDEMAYVYERETEGYVHIYIHRGNSTRYSIAFVSGTAMGSRGRVSA